MYSKVFLLQLGSEAVCQKKPDVLNNWSNLIKSGAPQFNSLGVSCKKKKCFIVHLRFRSFTIKQCVYGRIN